MMGWCEVTFEGEHRGLGDQVGACKQPVPQCPAGGGRLQQGRREPGQVGQLLVPLCPRRCRHHPPHLQEVGAQGSGDESITIPETHFQVQGFDKGSHITPDLQFF